MPALPETAAAWRSEILSGCTAALEEAGRRGALDDEDESNCWHLIEDEAVGHAFHRRGRLDLPPAGDRRDALMDEVTDLTVRLRAAAPGDPEDNHLNEVQFYALYYVAAHVHAGIISEAAAGPIVKSVWSLELPEPEDAEADEADEPWPVRKKAPTTVATWMDEVLSAWRLRRSPPPLLNPGHDPYIADPNDLRETALVLALVHRGAVADADTVAGLLGVIAEMEEGIADLGPELAAVRNHPPMAFTLYYLWTHILIGHADEDDALLVVHAAHEREREFGGFGKAKK